MSEPTPACERCQEYADDARAVLAQECTPDEKHCSCVPHLRTETARLQARVTTLEKAINRALFKLTLRQEIDPDLADELEETVRGLSEVRACG